MSLKNILSGTGVAIITPFKKDESIDFDALGKVIDFIINNGVNYIVSLGTTGETPVLDFEEKKDILQYTFDKVNDRVPIVMGVGGNNTKAVINEINALPIEIVYCGIVPEKLFKLVTLNLRDKIRPAPIPAACNSLAV